LTVVDEYLAVRVVGAWPDGLANTSPTAWTGILDSSRPGVVRTTTVPSWRFTGARRFAG